MTPRKLNIIFLELLYLPNITLELPKIALRLPLRLALSLLRQTIPLRLALKPLPLGPKEIHSSQRLGMCQGILNLQPPPTNNSESVPQVSSHAQVIYVKP